ncbi:TonB-dependent receptor, partial [Klebsiella pneumoniae]|uniref:TonB-dependent receptor domain-containing protein n=1 Tax=Klebsiella pneumoniae TaxID=573 RepID=UPI0022712A2C
VRQWGFYAGDQWRPVTNLTLTYGVRADMPTFPDKPTANPLTVAGYGYRTDEVPTSVMWSPRVGFNYALSTDNSEQIRGGVGLFSGRTP